MMANEKDSISQKQMELKNLLKSGRYASLADVILDGTGQVIKIITRTSQPISAWYSGMIIGLMTLFLSFFVSILLGETGENRVKAIPIEIWTVALGVSFLIAIKVGLRVIYDTLCDNAINAIEKAEDIDDLQRWLTNNSSLRKQLLFSLFVAGISTVSSPLLWTLTRGAMAGFGPLIRSFIFGFATGLGLYFFIPLITLYNHFGKYQFKLYKADPSNSEVIDRLSGMKRIQIIILTILILLIPTSATLAQLHYSPLTINNSQFTIHNSFDLQAAIDAARPGDVIQVPPGLYQGNFLIEKPITLTGIDWPILDGDNQGHVIEVRNAPHVTLRGLVIRNSGTRLDKEDAGIAVKESPYAVIENNRLENTLFGLSVDNSAHSRLIGNTIGAKNLDVAARGDGIRVWYSEAIEVSGNRVEGGRDVVFWYNNNAIIRDNLIANGRYGLHFMYCDDNLVENNRFEGNSVGAFLMYGRRLTLRHNIFANNRGPSGYGLGLKDVDGVEAADNLFSGNRVGMYFDNSPWSVDVSQHFSYNAFVYNDIGLLFNPSVKRNYFSQNSFVDNLEQVGLTGSGDFKDNSFTVAGQGNFWSDYVGYDANGDGLGDLPYVSKSMFENMMDKNPQLRLFQFSPAQQAIDLAARAFPIFQPKPKFTDAAPLVTPVAPAVTPPPVGSAWPIWVVTLILLAIVGVIVATRHTQHASHPMSPKTQGVYP